MGGEVAGGVLVPGSGGGVQELEEGVGDDLGAGGDAAGRGVLVPVGGELVEEELGQGLVVGRRLSCDGAQVVSAEGADPAFGASESAAGCGASGGTDPGFGDLPEPAHGGEGSLPAGWAEVVEDRRVGRTDDGVGVAPCGSPCRRLLGEALRAVPRRGRRLPGTVVVELKVAGGQGVEGGGAAEVLEVVLGDAQVLGDARGVALDVCV